MLVVLVQSLSTASFLLLQTDNFLLCVAYESEEHFFVSDLSNVVTVRSCVTKNLYADFYCFEERLAHVHY